MVWILFSLIAAIVVVGAIVTAIVINPNPRNDEMPKAFFVGAAAVVAFLWLIITGIASYGTLDNRSVGVVTAFGSIDLQNPITASGIFFRAPYKSVTKMEIRGDEVDVETGGNSMSHDKVALGVAVSQPYALNPLYAPYVLARVGDKEHFEARLKSSAQTALRDTVASMDWADVAVNKRQDFEQALHVRVQKVVAEQLEGLGFTKQEAENAFFFLPLQVKTVSLPERISQSNAELAAATVDLQRQQTLTSQAAEIAKRRQLEGEGINKMLAQLPVKGLTEHGVAAIISAQALENESLAVKAAVESGKVGQLTIIVSPSANTSVASK